MGVNDRAKASRLLIATSNKGKIAEYADLIRDLKIDWVSLEELGISDEVSEDGATFLENATTKALAYAQVSGLLTLADDSGLEVDALGGQPGVKTARFGGAHLSPVERYHYLLKLMDEVPRKDRTARFRCVIVLAKPAGVLDNSEGICHGQIAYQPEGKGGFGYDPIFYLPEEDKTMAQIEFTDKQRLSHRGRAFTKIKSALLENIKERG